MENQPPPIPAPVPMIPPGRNYWKLSTLILICICLGLTAIVAYQWKNVQVNPISQIERITPEPNMTEPVSTRVKTFSDTEHGVSFSYPGIYSEDTEVTLTDNPDIQIAAFKTEGGTFGVFIDRHSFSPDYLRKYAPTGSEQIPPVSKLFDKNAFYYYGSGGGGVNYPDQFFYNLNSAILIFKFYGPYGDTGKSPTEQTRQYEFQILSSLAVNTNPANMRPKKHFQTTDLFFDTTPYPSEITSLRDSDLTGFTCSSKYSRQSDGSFVSYGNDPQQEQSEQITDSAILSYLNRLDSEAKKSTVNGAVLAAMICKTDTGKTLLSYEITPGGGGAGASVYYGYFSGDSAAVAKVPIESGAYFTCSEILAITKTNTLYVKCGAGDGGSGSVSLYRVGLYKAYGADLLYKCTSTLSGGEDAYPKVTCGKTQ